MLRSNNYIWNNLSNANPVAIYNDLEEINTCKHQHIGFCWWSGNPLNSSKVKQNHFRAAKSRKSPLRKIEYICIVYLQTSVRLRQFVHRQTPHLHLSHSSSYSSLTNFLLDLHTDPSIDFNQFVIVEKQRGLNTPRDLNFKAYTISWITRFFHFTSPFCYGVIGANNSCLMPLSSHKFAKLEFSNSLSWSLRILLMYYPLSFWNFLNRTFS